MLVIGFILSICWFLYRNFSLRKPKFPCNIDSDPTILRLFERLVFTVLKLRKYENSD